MYQKIRVEYFKIQTGLVGSLGQAVKRMQLPWQILAVSREWIGTHLLFWIIWTEYRIAGNSKKMFGTAELIFYQLAILPTLLINNCLKLLKPCFTKK